MGWFSKKENANNVDVAVCNPIIVNQTNQSLVLFLDRGVLYNKQILAPGEAVGMTRRETAGMITPYKIHAVIGDAKSLPTKTQSMKNLLSTAVIPTAFIVGTFMAASSAGTLSGPSYALKRAAGGLVIRGMVIDSAALAAGSLTASRAAMIADKLIEQHPENYSAKSGLYMPGARYVVVTGGIDTPLTLTSITEKKFRQIPIVELKTPMDTLQDKLEYYTPNWIRSSTKSESDAKRIAAEAAAPDVAASTASAPPMMDTQTSNEQAIKLTPEQQAAMSEEERQLRQAIAESLKMEEERKQQEEHYQNLLKENTRNPVVLF